MTSHSLSVPYLLLPSIHQTHLIDDDNDLITVDRSIFNLSENRCYEWKNILNGHVGTWCVVPYLLLPSIHQTHLIDDDNDLITVDRSIFNLSENRCYEWKNILNGHVGAWCNGILLLLNPSSSTTINLPPLFLSFLHPVTYSYFAEYLRKIFIVKAILMFCSSSSSYTLAIIYGSDLEEDLLSYEDT
ncbi:hypothetical protein Ahy_B06g085324 [Arachis hypogaea]|uniref:Uncharacterized protein n=1 Tax=Arachis hypogaea TaxID=3818 RepID=A0A444YU54_ARAHY|nr:hypothetical protein Ahy_B06g085324 [Arachis hypogaea]